MENSRKPWAFALSAAAATLMLMGSVTAPAIAAEAEAINPNAAASLTIHKHFSGATHDPAGLPSVTFQACPVTGIDLTQTQGWTQLSDLDQAIQDHPTHQFPASGFPGVGVQSGSDCLSGVTDRDGETTWSSADGLKVGVYYVSETDAPAEVVQRVLPFLATIPTHTNDGANWEYDVHAYPKNAVHTLEKEAVDPGAVGVGQGVGWRVTNDVPRLDRAPSSYVLLDKLDSRLSYVSGSSSLEVGETALVPCADDAGTSPSGCHFTAVQTDDLLQLRLTSSGLQKAPVGTGFKVTWNFQTEVSNIGSGVIENKAVAHIDNPHGTWQNGQPTDAAVSLWGALKLVKKDSSSAKLLPGATFQVFGSEQSAASCAQQVKKAGGTLLKGCDKAVKVWRDVSGAPQKSGQDQFVTGADGAVVIPGLSVGTQPGVQRAYWLVETDAPKGYENANLVYPVQMATGAIDQPLTLEIDNAEIPGGTLPLTPPGTTDPSGGGSTGSLGGGSTVPSAGHSGSLPVTGAQVGIIAVLASGLLLAGLSARGFAKRRNKIVASKGTFAVVAVTALVGAGTLSASSSPAQAADSAPDPQASSTITKIYDGTGFTSEGNPSGSSTFVNAENGFYPGDNGPNDGVVSTNDFVGYLVQTRFSAGPERTVQVKFNVPQYLQLLARDNEDVCVSNRFITGTAITSGSGDDALLEGCSYLVRQGVGVAAQHNLTAVALDTAGEAIYDQIVQVSTALEDSDPHSSYQSEAVTVVSAPSADIVLRPSTCTLSGSCTNLTTDTTEGYLEVMVEALPWPGYDNIKGASTLGRWTAQLDVASFPSATSWQLPGQDAAERASVLNLGPYQGSQKIYFSVPTDPGTGEGLWAENMMPGETVSFDAHVIVPDTALASSSYKNNGTGWEPGQNQPANFSTLNACHPDRDGQQCQSGSREGYVHRNNDWTRINVYKQPKPDGYIFSKTLFRPWDHSQTLWEDANKYFAQSNPTAADFAHNTRNSDDPEWAIERPYGQVERFFDVTSQTQLYSQLRANTARLTGPQVTDLVVSDQWDPDFVQADLSRDAYVVDPQGNVLRDGYKLQWSTYVIGSDRVSQPLSDEGWVTSRNPVAGAVSVRAVFDVLPSGQSPEAGVYSVWIPTAVVDEPAQTPAITVDQLRGSCLDCSLAEEFAEIPLSLVTMATPDLGLKFEASHWTMPRDGQVTYTIAPNVHGLVSSTDVLNGYIKLTLDPCAVDYQLPGDSAWVVVQEDMSLSCGDEGSNTLTLRLGQNWDPSGTYIEGAVMLPSTTLNITWSKLTRQDANISALWVLDTIDGIQGTAETLGNVVPVGSSATLSVPGGAVLGQEVLALTPKVDVENPLKYQAVVDTWGRGSHVIAENSTVVVMPGRGNDKDFAQAVMPWNPSAKSSFSGTYEVSKLAVVEKDSVQGTGIQCTWDENPTLDPQDSQWSACEGDIARVSAVRIDQPGGSHAGMSVVDIQLQPTGNKAGDNYLMWIGPMAGEGLISEMSMPANEDVVASGLSGYVYWDLWGRGASRVEQSPGISGIKVSLLDSDGKYLDETLTDENGRYQFTQRPSGKYYVEVPGLGEEGGVPKEIPSKHAADKMVPVSQTHSYKGKVMQAASSKSTVVDLPLGLQESEVNFGFYAPDSYSDLVKSPAQVQCADDADPVCDVTWTVIVKSSDSLAALTDGILTDSTSKEVYNLEASITAPIAPAAATQDYSVSLVSDGILPAARASLPALAQFPAADPAFITRQYQLPQLVGGQSVTVTLRGKVNRPALDSQGAGGLVIGNQAWHTFKQTQREEPTLSSADLPAWDAKDPFAFGKWTGNETCTAFTGETWAQSGDQCDQVFASVPAMQREATAVEGYAWFDQAGSGQFDSADGSLGRLAGQQVNLYQGQPGDFSNPAGQAWTGTDGKYTFTDLVPSAADKPYFVVFHLDANPPVWKEGVQQGLLLEAGQSWAWTKPCQGVAYGSCSAANENGVTAAFQALPNQTAGNINGGVVVTDASLQVIKGTVPGLETENLTVNKETGKSAPYMLSITFTNNGKDSLHSLRLTDQTLEGVSLGDFQCMQASQLLTLVPVADGQGRWVADVSAVGGNPFTLDAGKTVACTAVLPAMSAQEVHRDVFSVDAVAAASGVSVSASDPWSATVDGVASWTLVKSVSPGNGTTVFPGQKLSYWLMAANTGDLDLNGIVADDDLTAVIWDSSGKRLALMDGCDYDEDQVLSQCPGLPQGVTYREGVVGGARTASLTWSVPALRAGAGASLPFSVTTLKVTKKQRLVNNVTGVIPASGQPGFMPGNPNAGLEPQQCYPGWFTETDDQGQLLHQDAEYPCSTVNVLSAGATLPDSGGKTALAYLTVALLLTAAAHFAWPGVRSRRAHNGRTRSNRTR